MLKVGENGDEVFQKLVVLLLCDFVCAESSLFVGLDVVFPRPNVQICAAFSQKQDIFADTLGRVSGQLFISKNGSFFQNQVRPSNRSFEVDFAVFGARPSPAWRTTCFGKGLHFSVQ